MEQNDIIALWKAYDKQLDSTLQVNRENTIAITQVKVSSLLSSMKPIKIFTLVTGILWVLLVDIVLISTYGSASLWFTVSMALQVILTKIAIGVYIYQLVLLYDVDVTSPVLETQEKIGKLQATTLWITRILFLQFPLWTTFYVSEAALANGGWIFYAIQIPLFIAFTWLALYVFINGRFENRKQRWFRLIFRGREWTPMMKAAELIEEIDELRKKL